MSKDCVKNGVQPFDNWHNSAQTPNLLSKGSPSNTFGMNPEQVRAHRAKRTAGQAEKIKLSKGGHV